MFERKIELIISFYNSWIVIVIWKIFITEILFKQERGNRHFPGKWTQGQQNVFIIVDT